MLESPFELIALVLAIAALLFARKAYDRAERLRERLDALEARGVAPAAQTAPPPLPQFEQTAPAAPFVAAPDVAPPLAEAAPAAQAATTTTPEGL